MTTPRVLVVEHQESCPPALFGGWLTEAGCELHVVRPYEGDDMPDPRTYDGLVVLGGTMGANDDATVPWLGPLKTAMREAVLSGMPTLGICLGHQLLAVALGGVVATNPRGQTLGVVPIGWQSTSAEDLLTADCSGEECGIHWNSDVVVELPGSAVALALTPDGDPQVVHFGRRAWGIQAHPEADETVVRRWAEIYRAEHVASGIDQDALLAAIKDAEPALARHWQPVAERFAAMVGDQHVRREPA